jgi:hypothetical protein|tara:strand:+ start:11797 stop:12264 length:468 start_codon:yes stop_codon:yes gene_type:complete
MAGKTIQTDEMVEEIITRVSSGETLTGVCRDDHMPSIRSLMSWLSADDKMDDRMHRARIRGTLIQADEAVDAQRSVIDGTASVDDPKRLQAIVTAANNMGHQANAKLSKIDNRYKDKQAIEHTGPMVIGWEQQPIAVEDLRDAVLDVAVSNEVVN